MTVPFVFVVARGAELFFLVVAVVQAIAVPGVVVSEVLFGCRVQLDRFIIQHHGYLSVYCSLPISSRALSKLFGIQHYTNRITPDEHK
ncbi:MAG: hypothetical protein ABI147_06720 [Acidobacteriaceae bacterium]